MYNHPELAGEVVSIATGFDRNAVLYVRSVAPYGLNDVQRRTIERLHALRGEGVLDAVDYEVWGRAIPDDSRTEAARTFERFVEWADEHGYSLAPGFGVRETGTLVSDRSETVISFPLLCLGVYERGRVEAVFPCTDEERTYTVEDGLRALEAEGRVDLTTDADRSRPLLDPIDR